MAVSIAMTVKQWQREGRMDDDLLYLLQRYTVQIEVKSSNWGTSSDQRYYTATVMIKNGSTQLSMSGSSFGKTGDAPARQEAIQSALDRVMVIAKAIEEAA